MRKLIIIGVLVLVAAWLLLMPALVGLYLRDAVPTWLAEWSDAAQTDYRPGWFGSRLQIQSETDLDLVLRARHFPPLKTGWLALEGELDSPLTPRAARVEGHLGLTGSWHVRALAERFRTRAQGGLLAQQLSLNLSQVAGQPVSLVVNAERVDLNEQAPRLLDARARGLRRVGDDGRISLGLDLQARTPQLGSAVVTLRAGPIDPAQLELLVQGVGQLAESSPGSMSEGMALMTLAGAWQEMAADGLVIELERLQLGEQTFFQGRWQAGQPTPAISGTGELDELENWLVSFAPQTLSDGAQNGHSVVDLLSELGELEVDEQRFRISSRSLPSRSTAYPNPRPAP
ncbi:MAG: hypothetical protein ACOCVP_05080 [Wenzhouxiangella sp.]